MSMRWHRGLTLLELLVTLVIAGMVATLALQALQQFARVERLLEDAGSDGQQRMVRREWLRQLLAGAQPEQVSTPLQFIGDAKGFQFRSNQHLQALGNAPLRVEMQYDTKDRSTVLLLRPLQPPNALPIALLSWPGEPGAIRYQDVAGTWHERWPAAMVDPEVLRRPPALVRIEAAAEAGGVLLLPIAGTEGPRPRLADWTN